VERSDLIGIGLTSRGRTGAEEYRFICRILYIARVSIFKLNIYHSVYLIWTQIQLRATESTIPVAQMTSDLNLKTAIYMVSTEMSCANCNCSRSQICSDLCRFVQSSSERVFTGPQVLPVTLCGGRQSRSTKCNIT
jgi:hypothetical protein